MTSGRNPLFLVGTGRCGSTLVHEVLARHPEVGFVSNVDNRLRHGSGRLNGPIYRRVPSAWTVKGRARFAPSEAYELLAAEVSPLLVDPFRDLGAADVTPWLADRLRQFFSDRGMVQRAGTFIHKFTGWPRVGLLASVFPGARFVHVVRDGRAVANSWLQMPWWRGHLGPSGWHFGPLDSAEAEEWEASGRSFVALAGIGWKKLMAAYEAAEGLVPSDRWLELRHEDVCADPRGSIERLLQFAGLDWTREFETGFARHAFRVERPRRVEEELGSENYRMLTSSLAGHLARHGYPTA